MRILNIGFARPGALVALGRVSSAHGIRGEVKVSPYSGHAEGIGEHRRLLLLGEGVPPRDSVVEQWRVQSGLAVLRLTGCSTRDQAEALRGMELCVPAGDLPPAPAGWRYWHELAGVAVATVDGRALGALTALLPNPGHDLLEVAGEGGEYLIPAVDQFIVGMAGDGQTLLVDPPPGLLELNR
ncbi:MAG: ribosome maturation factor RimM [Thermodesulfobacteriota bacterium]